MAQYVYKPSAGDKFTYRISKNNKANDAVFIYDIVSNLSVFYWKSGVENPLWGKVKLNSVNTNSISSNLYDSTKNTNSNFIFLKKESLKLFKSKKKILVKIDEKDVELRFSKTEDYNLPIWGASFKFKLITLQSTDKRYSISFIDNPDFALIVSLLADAAWQLQSIVPLPMYPITFDIVGKTINDKSVLFFKNYIKGTCTSLKAEYTENYKNIVFDEYFCPIAGVRYTLKNDTIQSVVLIGKNSSSDGFDWKSYKGFFWGVYKLGITKSEIDKNLGNADSAENGKYYYRNRSFYLIFNEKNVLVNVEYE